MTVLTPDVANAVFDILVEHVGANEASRENFVHLQTDHHLPEYRFVGSLGFGGKFRRNTGHDIITDGWGEIWYTDCYPEDLTTERIGAMAAANIALSKLCRSIR